MPLIPVTGQPINLSAETTLVTKDGKATTPFWIWLSRLNSGILTISGMGIASSVTPVVDGQIVLYDGVTGQLVRPATTTGVVHATLGVYSASNVLLASEVSGRLPYANLTASTAASRLLGRGSASGAGDWEEITPGTGLTMSGTTLNSAGGDVTHTGTLTNHALIKGNGGADISALGSLGTTTTVLHGNASGDPSFATVTESDITLADVTTLNVSTSKHGLAPKSPNDATYYLDGTGAYSVPGGTGPGGFVNASGSPASGNLTKWAGATSITNGDLSGDATTSGTLAVTLANSGVTAASYTNANVTFDAKGRATAASNGTAPGWVKLDEVTPTGTVATFSSLGSYTHLKIVYVARGDASATSSLINLNFNADTGGNYDAQRSSFGTTTVLSDQVGQTSGIIGAVTAATGPSSYASGGEILIHDYRGTTFFKTASSQIAGPVLAQSTTNIVTRIHSVFWRSASAITSITLTLNTGNYVSGSKFSLYGIT